jgi:hypothetical protein
MSGWRRHGEGRGLLLDGRGLCLSVVLVVLVLGVGGVLRSGQMVTEAGEQGREVCGEGWRGAAGFCSLFGCRGQRGQISSRHQVRGEGESKNHKNGEEMPQALMSTLVDCYFSYV